MKIINSYVTTVTVKKGDTLSGIVMDKMGIKNKKAAHAEARVIAEKNGIENPDRIYPGQIIRLPHFQNTVKLSPIFKDGDLQRECLRIQEMLKNINIKNIDIRKTI